MPFWGGSEKKGGEADFSSTDETSFAADHGTTSIGMGGAGEVQQLAMHLQQQVVIQTIITNLTDMAFERCITGKPSDSLSGAQAACIQATVNKMMDTNEFMMGRLAKKQQQASAGSNF